ncbi:MAG: acyl-CoA dehydrogenase family protein [Pseudomonadales bacterium]|jgi:acyl-CoA dehydrogenase|nr:acyl-CoA dehydrogenase family protein [Pseudomonadales bacterium]MCP5332954.1 acyl-CoA dehydrogenase family protein [Pseudomonadales bacterium]
MDFELNEEYRLLNQTVERFVNEELMPLESVVLAREASGQGFGLTPQEEQPLHAKCRELGLWGLDAPAETGGADLPALALTGVNELLGRTVVPFSFPPDSPNLHMLLATANAAQRSKYLEPYARGETLSAIAISEPGAGADPAGMTTRARRDGDDWVLNGRKIWISRADKADFTIVMAVTDPAKGSRGGISAFLVDRGTPGFGIARKIPMVGGGYTCEVLLDECRLPASQLLGNEGQGFAPMQLRLVVRRLQMGAWCLGMAGRALDMLCDHANQRHTFGQLLADRQSVQWWVADATTRIHCLRLMLWDAAVKQDSGRDVRTEASMIKLYGTELASDVIDHAMQVHGAMGMTKELPLQLMAQQVRLMRIFEGPSEVHRWVIARERLRQAGRRSPG